MEVRTVSLLTAIILFLSTLVRATIGFGDALIAMPLLAMVMGVQTATPLVALVSSTSTLIVLLGHWRRVDLSAAWRLIVSSLVGIPLGLLFLKQVPESAVEVVLGALLVVFGLYNLVAPELPTLRDDKLAYAYGLVAGVLGGAYNTNGPPIVIYGAMRNWPPDEFLATLQCYFLPTGLMILVGHALAGLWTPPVLRLYACMLPVTVLAAFLGSRLNRYIPGDRFSRIIYGFLVVSGMLLVIWPQ